jgi:hypothetical protein
MRLDHISYVASHDQLIDVVQRIGSRIGSSFIDGGIHPRFGTRNFVLPLRRNQYLEVVCPLDHPAADESPFGRVVSKKANEGGGWLTWVVSTEDIGPIEKRLGRQAVIGHRRKPGGTDLRWKQIGVLGTLSDSQLPFFIEWETSDHPSKDGNPVAEITSIEISGNKQTVKNWLNAEPNSSFEGIEIVWIDPNSVDGDTGIVAVNLDTPNGNYRLD